MKTYILTGGNDRGSEDYGIHLSKKVYRSISEPQILSCFFTLTESSWPGKYADWGMWFRDYFSDIVSYELATPNKFIAQIKDSNIIYLHGDTTKLLIKALTSFLEIINFFEGKIIVGSSAGANFLSKNYWSSTNQKAGKGAGVLDVNIMVHYGVGRHEGISRTLNDWEDEEAEFQSIIGENETITHIPEGQFVIFKR